MSIVLTLPDELESKVASIAREHGLSVSAYVQQLLESEVSTRLPAKNGSELLAYWQQEGLIGSRTDLADSAEHARTLRQQAETRQRG
jgi:hypothetical protein